MSRYTILLLLNIPLISAGILNALVAHKLGRLSRKKFLLQVVLWCSVFGGLILAEPTYRFLFANRLTDTEPLSLFDVIQITGILFILFTVSRYRIKINSLERRVNDLHQELSIRLSKDVE